MIQPTVLNPADVGEVGRCAVLNIGCGHTLLPDAVNLDVVDYGQEVLCDINAGPLPFKDDQFERIICHHILEHVRDFHPVISELYRVAKPEAEIDVRAPFFLSTKYYGEPDHKIPFSIRTFDNYEQLGDRRLRWYESWKLNHRTNYNGSARFRIRSKRFHVSNFAPLRWLDPLVNLEPVIFERLFGSLLPPEEVTFVLEVVKQPRQSLAQNGERGAGLRRPADPPASPERTFS